MSTGMFTPGSADSSLVNPMTTGGDMIYGGTAGAPARLANGSAGQVLTSAGSTNAPTWVSTQGYSSTITGTMSTSSTSTADYTVSGLSNTAHQNVGWPTVTLSGSSAGWTFTPTKLGVIRISVVVNQVGSGDLNATTNLTDGSNNTLGTGATSNFKTSGETQTVTLVGIINVTSLSAITIKIRGSVSSGTVTIGFTGITMSY